MAKQLGVIQYRGKLGQTVGMKNGYGGSSSFSREYVSTNSSQSDAQILQRVRMLPAVNFRRQLEQVISRAWQGVKYGGPSTREFMRYALREPLANIPQLEKDDTTPWPGDYLISKGSLPQVFCDYDSSNTDFQIVGAKIPSDPQSTMGEVSASLVSAGLAANGDQLTFVCVSVLDLGSSFQPTYHVRSFQINVDDTTAIDEWSNAGSIAIFDDEGSAYHFGVATGGDTMAAAIVISRDGTQPKRSSARMSVVKTGFDDIYGSTLKEAVKKSYQKTTSTRQATDWPYDPDSPVAQDTMIDGTYTIAGLTGANAAFNGATVRVKRWETSGDLAAVYCKNPADPVYGGTAPFCVGTNNAVIVRTISSEEEGLSVSYVTAFNGLSRVIIPGD